MNRRSVLLAAALAAAPIPAFAQAARDNIDALIEQQAKANGVPASFVHQVVKRESNYNPGAKGGSALGLMQIKHATAKGMGYRGDAAGLYDPETNLRYGVAYLAGAYRTAKGNLAQAYNYYNKGYYYAAKRQGIATEVAEVVAPVAASASAFASMFALRPAAGDPNVAVANTALAYAPTAAATPTEAVEVPLPPRRPGALSGAVVQVASLAPEAAAPAVAAPQAGAGEAVEVPLPPRRPSALAGTSAGTSAGTLAVASLAAEPAQAAPAGTAQAAAADSVEVPLPPRRPAATVLAAAQPAAPARRATAPVLEASALPPAQ
ncbi:transglycosylase SLT domain-containing protein [Methylobacterium sp. A54F]